MRPFQGWRYYMVDDTPPDLNLGNLENEEEMLTDELNAELIKLGLY